jgi:hypothetical protein
MRLVFAVCLCCLAWLSPLSVQAADPDPSPVPIAGGANTAVRLAGTAARVVERDEATWRELTEQLVKAVEAYNPGLSANPLPKTRPCRPSDATRPNF